MWLIVKIGGEDLLKHCSDSIPNQGMYFFAEQNYQQKVILHRLHALNPLVFQFISVGNKKTGFSSLSIPHSREAASLTNCVGAGLFQHVDALIPLILLKYLSCLKILNNFLKPSKDKGCKVTVTYQSVTEFFSYSSWKLQRQKNIFVNWGGEHFYQSSEILPIILVFPLFFFFFSGGDNSLKGTECIYVLSWTKISSEPSLWGFTCRRGRSTRKLHYCDHHKCFHTDNKGSQPTRFLWLHMAM